jgi:YYY domain-containing protein
MLSFLSWYLVVSLLGWLSFPLAYRLFPALADRGYSLSRVLGLLVWGYLFWMLTSLGVTQNSAGGLLLALLILAALSTVSLPRKKDDSRKFDFTSLVTWLKSNRRMVFSMEGLFLVAFAIWTFIQACNPEITTAGGEKTMELAFINAIMRSPTFPPPDPWLSGYAISYYYFGYVITAMLAEVTGVVGSVAHNLMLCLTFALSALGAYGVFYDLLSAWNRKSVGRRTNPQSPPLRSPTSGTFGGDASQSSIPSATLQGRFAVVNRKFAFLGPFFLLIVSNFEGFLELLHRRGLFWKFNPDGSATSGFWKWLDIKDLSQPPTLPLQWIPDRFIWWWRASRVIQDHTLTGGSTEIIDEFPFFSYMLGDLHPHILAMPFDLLAIAFALNLFLGAWEGEVSLFGWRVYLDLPGFLFAAFVLGGLAFLNTWDILFGFALLAGVYLLKRGYEKGWDWDRLTEVIALVLPAGLLAILLYLPFYAGFSSQASGILPNLDSPTRGAQLWVFWGALFLPVTALLAYFWRSEKRPARWRLGLGLAAGLVILLWIISWLLGVVIQAVNPQLAAQALSLEGVGSTGIFFDAVTMRRLVTIGGWLTQLGLIGVPLAFLVVAGYARKGKEKQASPFKLDLPVFVLLLVLIAGILILAPDFVFLRDIFNDRMNTIFKFYYQGWLLLSLVAAFGVVVVSQGLRGTLGVLYRFGLALMLCMACTYPVLAILTKTDDFKLPAFQQALTGARAAGDPSPLRTALGVWTLDGAVAFDRQFPDDAVAVRWLRTAPAGVLAEVTKIDASYTDFAHISAYSGLPAVLGWPMHEDQWRGTYDVQGTRLIDIQRLYETRSWDEAKAVLDQYNIRYVYVGTLERSTYRVYEAKFQSHLRQVFKQGDVVIYEVP